jgi:hypothetical protein
LRLFLLHAGENVAIDVLDLLVVLTLKACLGSLLGCFSALHPCDEQYSRGHSSRSLHVFFHDNANAGQ